MRSPFVNGVCQAILLTATIAVASAQDFTPSDFTVYATFGNSRVSDPITHIGNAPYSDSQSGGTWQVAVNAGLGVSALASTGTYDGSGPNLTAQASVTNWFKVYGAAGQPDGTPVRINIPYVISGAINRSCPDAQPCTAHYQIQLDTNLLDANQHSLGVNLPCSWGADTGPCVFNGPLQASLQGVGHVGQKYYVRAAVTATASDPYYVKGSALSQFSLNFAVRSPDPVTITWASEQFGYGTPNILSSLTVNPTKVTGGQDVTGTVILAAPAGPEGATVALSSSDTYHFGNVVSVPTNVSIQPGATSASFTIKTAPPPIPYQVVTGNVVASLNGTTATASVDVTR
jgi:hypothetical protein